MSNNLSYINNKTSSRMRGPIPGCGFIYFKDEDSVRTFLQKCPSHVSFLDGK